MVLCPLGPSYSPSCSPLCLLLVCGSLYTDRNQLSKLLLHWLLQSRAGFSLLFFLCIVIISQIRTQKNTHNDCFISRFWQTQHAIVEWLYTMLPFCSNCYTNAKTQGYYLVSGCFSRAKTLTFFFPRRNIQIHAVLFNYVTSKPSFSFQLLPPQTLASSQIVICVSGSKAHPRRCAAAAQMKLIWC